MTVNRRRRARVVRRLLVLLSSDDALIEVGVAAKPEPVARSATTSSAIPTDHPPTGRTPQLGGIHGSGERRGPILDEATRSISQVAEAMEPGDRGTHVHRHSRDRRRGLASELVDEAVEGGGIFPFAAQTNLPLSWLETRVTLAPADLVHPTTKSCLRPWGSRSVAITRSMMRHDRVPADRHEPAQRRSCPSRHRPGPRGRRSPS